jgi:hypothetical protein
LRWRQHHDVQPSDKAANLVLSNGNLTAAGGGGAQTGVRSIASYSSGKYYAEFTFSALNASNYAKCLGIANSSWTLTASAGAANLTMLCQGDPLLYSNGGNLGSTGITLAASDVVSMAVDIGNQTIWFRQNGGNWNGNVSNDPATNSGGKSFSAYAGAYFAAVNLAVSGPPTITANFGATAYTYTPPSGFGNW